MSSVCHIVHWDWTLCHPHASQWGDVCVRQQDVRDNVHDFGCDWRLHYTDVNHLAELFHHRLKLGLVQLLGAVQLTIHQLLDHVHDISRIVWRKRTGRVTGELKPQHLPRRHLTNGNSDIVYIGHDDNVAFCHVGWSPAGLVSLNVQLAERGQITRTKTF